MKKLPILSTLLVLCLSIIFSTTIFATNPDEDKTEYTLVVKDHSLVFDVLESDENEAILKFGLVMPAAYGEVQANKDYSFTYQPESGLCDEMDSFSYFVESTDGRDTVTVFVDILCESITIMSGFSLETKQEEEADKFTIIGVENYPNNSLYIFNSEGNEVYYTEGYQNDWNGRRDGEPLSTDYVYYYVFSNGEGDLYSGYININ